MASPLYSAPYDQFSYREILSLISNTCKQQWELMPPIVDAFKSFPQQVTQYNQLASRDFIYIAIVAVLYTLHRYLLTHLMLIPIGRWLNFKKSDQIKFPESCCKLLYFGSFTLYEYYLVNFRYPELRYIPGAAWLDWTPTTPVPDDIHLLYILQAGFYFHGIYATLFMDMWRKDSVAMVFHHVIANTLIIFSLAFRCHKIGLVVLYLHDNADVALESTKILTCFNNREKNRFWDFLTTCGFLSFTVTWFFMRLYVYPLIVLFSSGHVLHLINGKGDIFYFFFNGMLFILFLLNVYWFLFIVNLILRIATGKSRAVEDIREDSDEEDKKDR